MTTMVKDVDDDDHEEGVSQCIDDTTERKHLRLLLLIAKICSQEQISKSYSITR